MQRKKNNRRRTFLLELWWGTFKHQLPHCHDESKRKVFSEAFKKVRPTVGNWESETGKVRPTVGNYLAKEKRQSPVFKNFDQCESVQPHIDWC